MYKKDIHTLQTVPSGFTYLVDVECTVPTVSECKQWNVHGEIYLMQCTQWKKLSGLYQWIVLVECTQWNVPSGMYLVECTQWIVLVECTQWNVPIVECTQWNVPSGMYLLRDVTTWKCRIYLSDVLDPSSWSVCIVEFTFPVKGTLYISRGMYV